MIDLDYFADESACLSSTLSDIEIINEGPIIKSLKNSCPKCGIN